MQFLNQQVTHFFVDVIVFYLCLFVICSLASLTKVLIIFSQFINAGMLTLNADENGCSKKTGNNAIYKQAI